MVHTCDLCHLTYSQGDRSDAAMHRRRHAKYQGALEPALNPRFLEHMQRSSASIGELVTTDSLKWLHREIYWRARLFKWEFGYDSVQWGGTEDYKNRDWRWQGHLFSVNDDKGPTGLIGGACAFYDKAPGLWSLAWVWVAPKYRRSGFLTQRWPSFLERYGDFILEHPFSPAMSSFLARRGTEQQASLLQFHKGVGMTTIADILNAPDRLVQETSGPQSTHSRAFRALLLERDIGAAKFDQLTSAYVKKMSPGQPGSEASFYLKRASLFRTLSSSQMSQNDYNLALDILDAR